MDPTPETRRKIAFTFAVHYGIFHGVYFVFLHTGRGDLSREDLLIVLGCVTIFFLNHGYSFRHNLESDLRRKPNMGSVMLFPYARILPMHLTIIFGGFLGDWSVAMLLLFFVLKTLADLIMHLVEHWEDISQTDLPGTESSLRSE